MTEVSIIEKPVHWFAVQIVMKVLASISKVDEILSNEMENDKDLEYFREKHAHRIIYRDLIHFDIIQWKCPSITFFIFSLNAMMLRKA